MDHAAHLEVCEEQQVLMWAASRRMLGGIWGDATSEQLDKAVEALKPGLITAGQTLEIDLVAARRAAATLRALRQP